MKCPKCGSEDILPITYGTPPLSGGKLAKAVEDKTLILGGCALCGDAPAFGCRNCDHRFDAPEKEKNQSLLQRLFR